MFEVDNETYPGINSPEDLYEELTHIWTADTCAPRMRDDWTPDNMTLGHCSITAFLAQDIFGGKVYGVPLGDGNYHCYNVVGNMMFDLTSEQFAKPVKYGFRAKKLFAKVDGLIHKEDTPFASYTLSDGVKITDQEQFRERHFAKAEKEKRYELMKLRFMTDIKARQ